MREKRVVVPEGMLEAATRHVQGSFVEMAVQDGVKAALRWLSENPIVPTLEQWAECLRDSGMEAYGIVTERMGPGAVAEWQRHMFDAPEPEEGFMSGRISADAALEAARKYLHEFTPEFMSEHPKLDQIVFIPDSFRWLVSMRTAPTGARMGQEKIVMISARDGALVGINNPAMDALREWERRYTEPSLPKPI